MTAPTIGYLTHEAGHFMGKRWPVGTEVTWRIYDRDRRYIEVRVPDGYWLTMFPKDIKTEEEK